MFSVINALKNILTKAWLYKVQLFVEDFVSEACKLLSP